MAPNTIVSLSPNLMLAPGETWREEVARVESCQSTWFYLFTEGEIAYHQLLSELPPSTHKRRLAYLTTDTKTLNALIYTKICLVLEGHYIVSSAHLSISSDSAPVTTDTPIQEPALVETERDMSPQEIVEIQEKLTPLATDTQPKEQPARRTNDRSAKIPEDVLRFETPTQVSSSLRILSTWTGEHVIIQMKQPEQSVIRGEVIHVEGAKLYIYNEQKLRQIVYLTQVSSISRKPKD